MKNKQLFLNQKDVDILVNLQQVGHTMKSRYHDVVYVNFSGRNMLEITTTIVRENFQDYIKQNGDDPETWVLSSAWDGGYKVEYKIKLPIERIPGTTCALMRLDDKYFTHGKLVLNDSFASFDIELTNKSHRNKALKLAEQLRYFLTERMEHKCPASQLPDLDMSTVQDSMCIKCIKTYFQDSALNEEEKEDI